MAVSSDDVKLVLGPVEPQHYFYTKDGAVVKSLVELARTIELMDDSTFRHHVADGRNDFSSWIQDIVKDSSLANDIQNLKSKEHIIRKIEDRITQLRRLERKLNETETEKISVPGLQKQKYDSSSVKEYLYGLIIGIIVGVLIGLLI
ncbi:hypothetical protein KY311_03055 [Candidatus Woesearchaeota archaeon]|nr:hypothetical protein [Candidatus Woesearchaeota archaeon]